MNQENKVGFFEQYLIACFHPLQYKKLLHKKKGALAGYFCVLIFFLVFLESILPFAAWNVSVGGLENLFLNRIPKFSLENGQLQSESAYSFTIGGVLNVKVNSDVEEFEKSDLNEKYVEEILIGKKSLLVKSPSSVQTISFSQFPQLIFNNKNLAEMIPVIYLLLAIYGIMLMISKAVQYLFVALVFALICRGSVRTEDGKVVSMGQSFRISLYAKTIFAIIGSVNVALGYLVNSFLLIILSVMVTMGWIIRAEMSVLGLKTSKAE